VTWYCPTIVLNVSCSTESQAYGTTLINNVNKLSFEPLCPYTQSSLYFPCYSPRKQLSGMYFLARLVKHAYSLGHLGGDQWEWRKGITWSFWKPTKWCNFQTVNFVIFYLSHTHTLSHVHLQWKIHGRENILLKKYCISSGYLFRRVGWISPTCLRAAFTRTDPKRAKRQPSYQCLLRFWDLRMQKLLVKG